MIRAVEADEYRVRDLTTGTGIAAVWLPSADARAVETARKRVRACMSISAVRSTDAAFMFPAQRLDAYLAECAGPEDAELLTRASRQPAGSDIATLAVSHGTLCAIVVARSIRHGVESIESSDRLERFRGAMAQALNVD